MEKGLEPLRSHLASVEEEPWDLSDDRMEREIFLAWRLLRGKEFIIYK